MSRIHLTEQQWAFIQPLLPPPAHTGRPRAHDRRTIEGLLYILITGCRWQDLPREYGAPTTAWRRLKRWGEEGVWERIWHAALAALDQQSKLDWSMTFLDSSFAPAKRGGEHVGVTKKGKGTKWMLVVDGAGLPLGFHLESANVAEVKLATQTLDAISVPRARGRPSAARRSSWRIEGMIVAPSVLPCVVAASACAFRPSDAQRPGGRSGDAQWSRVGTTIGSVI
jgi:transposase